MEFNPEDITDRELSEIKSHAVTLFTSEKNQSNILLIIKSFIDFLYKKGYKIVKVEK